MTKPFSPGDDPDPRPGGDTFGKWFQEAMGGAGGGAISDFFLDDEEDDDEDWIPMSAEEAGPPARGSEILVSDSPRELMDRILDPADPLGLWDRVEKLLEAEALLIDVHRVCAKAAAHIAIVAVRDFYRGFPPLDEWLTRRIGDGIKDIADEDWAANRRQAPVDPENNPFAFMSEAAGIDPALARAVMHRFNQLPPKERKPVYRVLVKNQSFGSVADQVGMPADQVRALVGDVLSGLLGDSAAELLRRLEEELG